MYDTQIRSAIAFDSWIWDITSSLITMWCQTDAYDGTDWSDIGFVMQVFSLHNLNNRWWFFFFFILLKIKGNRYTWKFFFCIIFFGGRRQLLRVSIHFLLHQASLEKGLYARRKPVLLLRIESSCQGKQKYFWQSWLPAKCVHIPEIHVFIKFINSVEHF